MEAARRSLAFCSGHSRLAADNTNRVRRATCDNPQTRNGNRMQLNRLGPKKISMTEGEDGSNGGRKEQRGWETITKEMMHVGSICHGGVRNNNHKD